ncbi:MAG: putative bifunctional diguanylate cyclase/phosphodiesterase [Candidatus Nanopelagicales bacterium]
MAAVRRFLAAPVWPMILASIVLILLQTRTEQPVLLGLGFVMMTAVVLIADPWRTAWLCVVLFVLAALEPLLDESPLPDHGRRLMWIVLFAALAITLAFVERRRLAAADSTNRLLRGILAGTDQPIFVKKYPPGSSSHPEYVLTNDAWRAMTGVRDPTGMTDEDLFSDQVVRDVAVADDVVLRTGEAVTVVERVGPEGAEPRTFLVTKFPILDADGRPGAVGGIATDITDSTRSEQRLAAVFAQSPVPTLRLTGGGPERTKVVDANDAVRRLFGIDIVGASSDMLATLIHPDDVADTWALADSVIDEAKQAKQGDPMPATSGREIRLVAPEGGYRWVVLSVSAVGAPDSRGTQELIVQFDDITARKDAEAALTQRALTDSVTALPNRYALSDRLSTALHRLTRKPGLVCVLFCDLDHFKQVNDVFGHQVGDRLLSEVAARLASALRPEDTVGRQGGDEFVIVCEGFDDPTDAALLAVRLQDRLREPWWYGGHQFLPTASIGIAHTDDPHADPVDLLRQADVAMYRAKDSGRDRIETYDRSLDDELSAALEMQQRLRAALRTDGLVLHYQPVVRLRDGLVLGAEALVRMRDEQGGLIPPGVFLPHAEGSGLIGAVGSWVVEQALTDLKRWHDAGISVDVGVNISPTQMNRPGLAPALLDSVGAHGLDPRWVIVEVTETALVHESSAALGCLNDLHDAGVRIALDDFGTGYSSLSWLHQFPVDIVKIDKSFVQTVLTDHRRAVIVRALLDIADETGLGVVAEGVETEQQRAFLAELGCEAAQGWLFGRPVAADDPAWAAARTAGHAAGGRRPSR